MILWRLTRRPYADLRGRGGELAEGRWHARGRPVVYGASTAALAALEVRVHLDLPFDLLPDDYVLMGIAGSDDVAVRTIKSEELPEGWREPGSQFCRAIGDAWLAEALERASPGALGDHSVRAERADQSAASRQRAAHRHRDHAVRLGFRACGEASRSSDQGGSPGQKQLHEGFDEVEVAEQHGADRALVVRLGVAALSEQPAVVGLTREIVLAEHIEQAAGLLRPAPGRRWIRMCAAMSKSAAAVIALAEAVARRVRDRGIIKSQ